MKTKLFLISACLGLFAVAPLAVAQQNKEVKPKPAAHVVQKITVTASHVYFDGTIKDLIMSDDRFLVLARGLKVGKLESMLDSDEMKFTLFAPTNDALTDLPQERFVEVFNSQEEMRDLIFSHMVRGNYDLIAIMDHGDFKSMSGEEIDIDILNGLEIEEHNLKFANIVTKNGVVHIIDGVIPTNDIVDI